jgi:pyruvate formate lyase activating enzyme
MKIGGLQKTTLIDYPGKLACTVFTLGCNFRCDFCYSSELVLPEKIKNQPQVRQADFFNFLKEKKDLLEGVVICGGEPTIHKDLPSFIEKIKKMGFLVKLDTNGSNPEIMKKLIEKKLIDYVAMDIKAPKERYKEVANAEINPDKIENSINILKESNIDFEFRTTIVPSLLDKDDIVKMARWIGMGGKYYLQQFRAEKTINPKFEKIKPYPYKYLLEIKKAASPFLDVCEIRNLE